MDANDDSGGHGPAEDPERSGAILAFLGGGLASPPTKALAVSALAEARRTVASHQSRRQPLDDWLESQIRMRGIRENAAVLAVMETSQDRQQIADAYRREHPDRSNVLDQLLDALPPIPEP